MVEKSQMCTLKFLIRKFFTDTTIVLTHRGMNANNRRNITVLMTKQNILKNVG